MTRDKALAYLANCASPSPKTWSQRIVWRTESFDSGDPPTDDARLYADLTAQCIEGLALSGDQQAARELDGIRRHLYQKAVETQFGKDKGRLESAGYASAIVDRRFFADFDLLIRRSIVRNKAVELLGLDQVF